MGDGSVPPALEDCLIRGKNLSIERCNLTFDPGELYEVSGEQPELVFRIERFMFEAREPSILFPITVLDALEVPPDLQ